MKSRDVKWCQSVKFTISIHGGDDEATNFKFGLGFSSRFGNLADLDDDQQLLIVS